MDKAFNFDNFENSHISFLRPEYFRDYFVKMDPMSGFDIRLVFTFPPKDRRLSIKNAYTSEITFLALVP